MNVAGWIGRSEPLIANCMAALLASPSAAARMRILALLDALRHLRGTAILLLQTLPVARATPADERPERQMQDALAELAAACMGAQGAAPDRLLEAVTALFEEAKGAVPHVRGAVRNKVEPPVQARLPPLPPAGAGPGTSASTESAPVVAPDKVKLAVSAPSEVAPGSAFVVRFAAYCADDTPEAKALFDEIELGLVRRRSMGLHTLGLLRGSTVDLTLQFGAGLVLQSNSAAWRQLTWTGELQVEEFQLRATAPDQLPTTWVRLDLAMDGILLRQLVVEIPWASSANKVAAAAPAQHVAAALPCSAFASYASADRPRVLDRVSALRIATGIDIFVDCVDLRTGGPWKDQLQQEISSRELFILFWSTAASKSQWVSWEYRQAHAAKPQAMQIQPLENGVPPPRLLRHLHFSDSLNDVRNGALRSRTAQG